MGLLHALVALLFVVRSVRGKLVPAARRKPIEAEAFRYGRWAWIAFHFIVISTIFLAGVYVGVTLF